MEYELAESNKSREHVEQVEITIEEAFSRHYVRFCPRDAWKPNINIYESAGDLLICVDIAGMDPRAIHVEVEGRLLALRGERPRPIPEPAGSPLDVHLMEIDVGPFCREVELPAGLNHQRITASYQNGLLWITVPKLP